MLLNCGAGGDSWESLGLQGDPTSQSKRKSVVNIHWKDWCWSWNSNILATWREDLTHLKRPWCWEILTVGGERDDRGWDGWMASPTQWTWVWVDSGSWWWTGRPAVLQFMGLQRVRHDWATEVNWTELVVKILDGAIYIDSLIFLLYSLSPNHALLSSLYWKTGISQCFSCIISMLSWIQWTFPLLENILRCWFSTNLLLFSAPTHTFPVCWLHFLCVLFEC